MRPTVTFQPRQLRVPAPVNAATWKAADGSTYVTDSGNYLLDCFFSQPYDPPDMASRIKSLTGVVEHGLFIGLATRAIIAGADGVRVVDK